MTVIASVFVPSAGFVIAADGRCRSDDPANTRFDSDHAQKIFSVENSDRVFAFAIIGMGGTNNGNFVTVDEIKRAAFKLANRRIADADVYVHNLCHHVQRATAKARRDGIIPHFPFNEEAPEDKKRSLFRILVMGYFNRQPWLFECRFFYTEDERVKFALDSIQPTDPYSAMAGSPTIEAALYRDKDPRFARYTEITATDSLGRAEDCVRGYIEACGSSLALELDPSCKNMGGHTHIAEVTMDSGFRWRIPPIQESSSAIVQT